MASSELAHLELLAEVDALLGRLQRWADGAPDWPPAETCRALLRRLAQRADAMRVRLEAPLVVATLGGTGTGKSALVNALLGTEVVQTGRQRPTTARPALVCRPDLTPEMLGIDPHSVEVVHRDLPALAELVLIDCPDPDTTEAGGDAPAAETPAQTGRESNLARLRRIVPHCDVLLVTATQQKYRSARVADELAAAAPGARLVFVQTHAATDDDVRDDWRAVLRPQYSTGHVFLVDSLAALSDAQQEIQPRGEFAQLVDLLTRQLAGAAAGRIRRANFLDLVDGALARCRELLDEAMPRVGQVQSAVDEQRAPLAAELARRMQSELLASRRPWENRLLGRVVSRWGLSPFSLVLRTYQGLGGLLTGRLLWRARTPAQVALWGAVEGARAWRGRRQQSRADRTADRAVADCWDRAELHRAAVILEGYAAEAGLSREAADLETVTAEANAAAADFVGKASAELESLIDRLARRHTGWFTRWRYELLLLAMLGALAYRLGKNFFYDSWWLGEAEVYGLDFYVSAGFWLLLWCLVLIWLFTGRLRRGLRRQVAQVTDTWQRGPTAAGIFARLEADCRQIDRFRAELDRLIGEVDQLRHRTAVSGPEPEIGMTVLEDIRQGMEDEKAGRVRPLKEVTEEIRREIGPTE